MLIFWFCTLSILTFGTAGYLRDRRREPEPEGDIPGDWISHDGLRFNDPIRALQPEDVEWLESQGWTDPLRGKPYLPIKAFSYGPVARKQVSPPPLDPEYLQADLGLIRDRPL